MLVMTRGLLVAASLTAAIVLGCRAGSTGAPPTATAAPTESPVPLASLETLPPPQVLEPDLYDENGCLIVDPDRSPDCPGPSPSGEEPGEPVPPIYGFRGPLYTVELAHNAVVVIPEAVKTASSGTWEAFGILRNETLEIVGDVQVTATLTGADGAPLGTVIGFPAVSPIRPGEPAPFQLTSTVDAADVVQVEWSVSSAPTTSVPRQFLIEEYWSQPYGDRAPLVSLGEVDGHEPYPFLHFGSVKSRTEASVNDPILVSAWLDEDGRVIWIAVTPVTRGDGAAELLPGEFGDFLIMVDDPVAGPLLPGADHILWVIGGES